MSICSCKYGFAVKAKWLMTFFLILSFCFGYSQVLSEELDTIKIDTSIQVHEEEEEYEDEYEESTEPIYFSEKSGLTADSFLLRKIADSIVQKMKQDPDFWYADLAFRKSEPRKKNTGLQKMLDVLLWLIIIGGFAAFIMWYLANSNISIFQKKSRMIASSEEETETDDIFAINYQRDIDKAIANGNYRFAIRLMYLRLLKELSEKNIIRYKQERTNFDYLLQLSSTVYYHDFFRVTRNYEYSWYGQFDVSKDKFDIIRSDFVNFERKVITH